MNRNCLIVFMWLVGFGTLSAQWTPDIATLNYKTGLNEEHQHPITHYSRTHLFRIERSAPSELILI